MDCRFLRITYRGVMAWRNADDQQIYLPPALGRRKQEVSLLAVADLLVAE
jgi:hypothetical protein